MRLAVFSDVHGNLSALQAVLTDIATEVVDQIVFAGDLCLFGPRPAACVDQLRELNCISIYGNTDDFVLGRQPPPDRFVKLAKWTYEQLDQSQREWLDNLLFGHTFSPEAAGEDSLLIVHANPLDVNQIIFPPEEEQIARYGRVRQADEELDVLLTPVGTNNVAFGHLHIPFVRTRGPIKLFNISSVSMPGDGDRRAKYGLFSWQNDGWNFQRKYVSFDIAPEVSAFEANRPPGWQNYVSTIKAEGVFPQKV
jgi:predicted phosphodiesterase